MKRRALIALICLFALCLVGAQAQEEFVIDAETGILTAYTGTASKVEIPAIINGIPLRALGTNVFGHQAGIEEVVIPEGVTHIMSSAFYACDGLKSVSLPPSLQSIDEFAFFLCGKLEKVILPANLVYVGSNAFYACDSLKEVHFLGEVPYISKEVFDNGPMERVFTVPEGEIVAFEGLLGSPVTVGEAGTANHTEPVFAFDSINGLITGYEGYAARLTIPGMIDGQAVTGIADRAFFGHKWLRILTLEEGIKEIGHSAFLAAPLAVVNLPGTLERIGEQAFTGSKIERINFPNALREIGKGAFKSAKLTEITLPEGLSKIEEGVFESCWNLEDVYLPASLADIGSRAFFDCSALSYLVFVEDTPPVIAEDAFTQCPEISDIDIAWTATRAQAEAFAEAFVEAGIPNEQFTVWRADNPAAPPFLQATTMKFDEETQLVISSEDQVDALHMYFSFWKQDGSGLLPVKGLSDGVFEGSTIKQFYVPHNDQFAHIGKRAFANSALETIDLFDSVEVIDDEAFLGCEHLKEITIPASVQRIGERAFADCVNLERVIFEGNAIQLGQQLFKDCGKLSGIVLPGGTQVSGSLGIPAERIRVKDEATDEQVTALHTALGMSVYEDLLREREVKAHTPMPDHFVANADSEFEFDAETGTIKRYIGASETVVIPSQINGVDVREIGFNAFSNLTVFSVLEGTQDNISLRHVVIPETVQVIGDSTFLSCKSLERVDCYGSIHSLGVRAFEECSALTEVNFYNNLYEMGGYTFHLCESLNSVYLGTKLKSLPEGAFNGCGFEGDLVLSVPVVGAGAYQDCAKVITLHILPSVTEIGQGAFAGMDSLREVYFEKADPGILGEFRYQFDPKAEDLMIYLPLDTSDEILEAFIQKLKENMLAGEGMVERKNCPLTHDSNEPASAPAPVDPVQPAADAPTAALDTREESTSGLQLDRRYVCVSATTAGIAVDVALIGEYAAIFSDNKTAVLTIAGTALPPLPYTEEAGIVTVDYYGQALVFNPLPDGQYELNFFDSMLLVFEAE